MAQAFVGTSGWSYDHWRNDVFYPAGLPAPKWLGFLADRFDTVELNASFYRIPTQKAVQGWAGRLPEGFPLAVKLWRGFTHYNRLEDPGDRLPSVMEVLGALSAGQRGPLLVQLPPQMKADAAKLDRFLRRLEPFGWRTCVEFRNASWLTPGIRRVLDDRRAALCVHDMEWAAPVKEPNDGAPFVYVRRHGPDSRYGGTYSDAQVRADAKAIQRWLKDGRDVFVYYNNDGKGYAVRDAARLKGLVHGAHDPKAKLALATAAGVRPPPRDASRTARKASRSPPTRPASRRPPARPARPATALKSRS